MPITGSQIVLCDIPIRFDTYKGCSHGCKYCFSSKKIDISQVELGETRQNLINFIKGKRTSLTNWCDWDIPLHWGGMSDPFQPAEKEHKRSLECLKVFADTGYPFVVSTKGVLIAEPEYLNLFKECNTVIQVSLVSPQFDVMELGAGKFTKRLNILEKLANNSKRLIIRAQPYLTEVKDDIMEQIKIYKELGVYGIVLEGMKLIKKTKGFIRHNLEYIYPIDTLQNDFKEFREECYNQGLKFYSGENRLRYMGDSLTCCGCDDMPGFKVNTANMNYYLFDRDNYRFTKNMENTDTGGVFLNSLPNDLMYNYCKTVSYKTLMDKMCHDSKCLDIYKQR